MVKSILYEGTIALGTGVNFGEALGRSEPSSINWYRLVGNTGQRAMTWYSRKVTVGLALHLSGVSTYGPKP